MVDRGGAHRLVQPPARHPADALSPVNLHPGGDTGHVGKDQAPVGHVRVIAAVFFHRAGGAVPLQGLPEQRGLHLQALRCHQRRGLWRGPGQKKTGGSGCGQGGAGAGGIPLPQPFLSAADVMLKGHLPSPSAAPAPDGGSTSPVRPAADPGPASRSAGGIPPPPAGCASYPPGRPYR